MASEDKDDFVRMIKNAGASILYKAKEAAKWYADKIKNIFKAEKTKDPSQLFQKVNLPEIGKMYIFLYDAKHKDTLPFWDSYPLVFPIEFYTDGFLGINLHYLPPLQRATLLTKLMELANNDKYDDSMKLNISYGILKAYSSQFKGYENCVKRYLFGHVKSKFNVVHPSDWGKVCLLPLQKWNINPNRKYAQNPPY